MKPGYKAALALAFVIFELSFWSIFLKIGGESIGILPQLFYGFLVGLIVSLSVSIALGRTRELTSIFMNRSSLMLIAGVGLLNNAFTQLFLGIGTIGTNPSIGAVIYRSWVIMTALLAPILLRQKFKNAQLIAAVLGFLGIYAILSGGTFLNLDLPSFPFIAILLVSGLCTSLAGIFMNRYNFDPPSTIVLFNLSSLIIVGIIALATNTSLAVSFTASSAISVLFLGIFAYGIGSTLVYYSFKVYGPYLVGNAIAFVPFVTIVLSAFIANTPIRAYYLLAAVLITAGVLIQRKYSMNPEHKNSARRKISGNVFDVTSAFVNNKGKELRKEMHGSRRAFAIMLSANVEKNFSNIFAECGCTAFLSSNPHAEASREEIEQVFTIMKLKGNETVLIGMGNPKDLERAFEKFQESHKRAVQ